jgi:ribose transport system permease protein
MAAAYSGVRVGRVMTTVFGLSGFFAGTAGILIIAWLGAASPKTADNLMLPALAAVVLGGTAITGGLGSIWRTAVGAFIMAVLRVGMDVAGIRPMYQPVIYGVLIIVAVGVTIDRTRLRVVK